MSNSNAPLNVRPVRAFADNYIWLAESPRAPGRVVAVDPGDAEPVLAELQRSGASLAAILLTHHHADHIGGAAQLRAAFGVPVIGPDDARIPGLTQVVRDQERLELPDLGLGFETLHVPGHTVSHVAFWGHDVLFCGDTLFSAGCGRMFEGTATQMTASLLRLRALPPQTRVYCGHEYTAANVRFALAVEPDNALTAAYRDSVAAARAIGAPSLPSVLSLEVEVNPFLRCDILTVRRSAERHAARPLSAPSDVFAELRGWKDTFQ